MKVHLHHFSKIKSPKEVGIKVFSYYFCLMKEGSGSTPLTSESGSGRPKTCESGGSGFGSGTLVSSIGTV
jgi:hypothetical protein